MFTLLNYVPVRTSYMLPQPNGAYPEGHRTLQSFQLYLEETARLTKAVSGRMEPDKFQQRQQCENEYTC